MEHVLWTCPGAQQFWGRLWVHWTGLPFEQDANDPTPLHHIFARAAPKLMSPLPRLLHDCAKDDVSPTESVQSAWEVICTVAAQSLWLKRNDAQFRTSKFTLVSLTEFTWAAVRRHLAGLYGVKAGGRPFTVFWETLSKPRDRHDHRLRRVRLYFDGGSRGNPGVSGGGSVLLAYDESNAAWTLLWWTARYVGDHTTNNHAEHAALLTGLEECVARFAETPIRLTIIGDSKLVLSQVAGTAASQVDLLQEFTKKTTRLLNTIQAVDLKHTLRAGNKMADYLANTAMDQRISIAAQNHWTSIDDHLTTLLPHEISHPTSSIRRSYNLLHDVAAAILRHQVSTDYSPPSE